MRSYLWTILCFLLVAACMASEAPYISESECDKESSAKGRSDGKFYSGQDDAFLSSLAYPSEIVGWNEKGRHVEKISQTPQVALKIPEGWLVGASRGEWGGEAVFIKEGNPPKVLIKDNIEDIYQMPFGYVVTAGLDHLSSSRGNLYVVKFSADGAPKTEILYALSGQPDSSWKLSDGDLLVNTRGSSVVLDQDARLHRVRCKGMEYEPASDPVKDRF